MDETSDALEDLWRVLGAAESLDTALDHVVDVVHKVVSGAAAVSVTMNSDNGPRTAASSHEWAVIVDKNQYKIGDGPCLEAARLREMVLVSGAEAFERWPEFAADATVYGVRAYLCAPLILSTEQIGALNVYGFREDAFSHLDEALLRLVTTAVSAVIANVRQYQRMRDIADNLRVAMASRAEIEQAKGVLMAVHGITADEAFGQLVTQSQRTNTKLATLARQLLASLLK